MPNAILRETYEWASIWLDHADDLSTARVLLIGDSISCGYTNPVTKRLEGVARVDRLGTSRSVTDPALFKEIIYVLGECRYRAIHFNNGLHGVHISDEDYGASLRQCVRLLRQYGQGARLVWASSTPVTVEGYPAALEAEKNAQVLRRNEVAAGLMPL